MTTQTNYFQPMDWKGDHLALLDQRLLPHEERWLKLFTVEEIANAISQLAVRGAPAIGITAAYGAVLAAQNRYKEDMGNWYALWVKDCQALANARPTAVNLRWALEQLQNLGLEKQAQPLVLLEQAAIAIHQDDIACNKQLAKLGSALITPESTLLTHCNTGPLATGAIGTALGVIIESHKQGKVKAVYADETRPWLQGSRLTLWELQQAKVPCQVIIDSANAWLMKSVGVDWLIVGADRVTANGDVANKIGTYNAMLAAKAHGVKTMVVIPWSSLDLDTVNGSEVTIEQREISEVLSVAGHSVAPENAQAWNPVFDITPANLVDYLVTERGVIEQPNTRKIRALE